MFRIYIVKGGCSAVACDYIYQRETYKQARQLANSQQKDYVDKVEIDNLDLGKTVYRKVVNEDRTAWTVEEDLVNGLPDE